MISGSTVKPFWNVTWPLPSLPYTPFVGFSVIEYTPEEVAVAAMLGAGRSLR